MSAAASALAHWEGEPVPVLEALWGVPRLEAWPVLGSTNDRLAELAREDAPAFTMVVADEQRAGRGRGGRPWSSPPRLGLWMSVLLRPQAPPTRLLTPLLAGLAVARAVEDVRPGVEAGLKWPNDVLVDGRKLCGILCEGAGEAVVVGIGLNVAQDEEDFPPGIRQRAVSLGMAGEGAAPSRSRVAGAVLRRVREVFARPVSRLEGALADEYRARDVLAGLSVRLEDPPGVAPSVAEPLSGIARGVDAGGALLIEGADGGRHRVVAGSVRIEG